MGQLHLKVEDVYCIQWNQQEKAFDVTLRNVDVYRRVAEVCRKEAELQPLASYKILNLDRPNFRTVTLHMFNPFVTDLALAQFLGQYGEVVTAARYVKDPMGFWTGRRQFQVLLSSDPQGPDGLRHPPAFFSLGGDRGFLFYTRQPAFCRRCRKSGHTEAGCTGVCCRFCGQVGHEAKECTAPKACHGCGGLDHLYRSCPDRRKTFAEVAKTSGGLEGGKEQGMGPRSAGNIPERPVQAEPEAGPSESGVEATHQEQGSNSTGGADGRAQASSDIMEVVSPALTPGPSSSKAKQGARKVSQVFGAGLSVDSGVNQEAGHSKRSKGEGEGEGEEGQLKEERVDGRSGEGVGRQRRVEEQVEEGGVQERGGGDTGQEMGAGLMEQTGGDAGDLLSQGLGLDFELSPGLLLLSSPLGENAYEGPNRPSTSPNTMPFSWADQMDSEDLYSQ